MKIKLIRQLNQLNHQFYQQVAADFSSSRSYYWQGWNKLVPYVEKLANHNRQKVTVLDLGCGNGRFGLFLSSQLPKLKLFYLGLDNSKELLQLAKTQHKMNYIDASFIETDLVELLLKDKLLEKVTPLAPQFITTMGLLHHVPSFKLRKKLIINLAQILPTGGYLTFTTWNFLDNKRFHKKIVDPTQFELEVEELEKNDVILDWKKNKTAYRYCHHTDTEELKKLVAASGLTKISQFKADGKSGKLNTYTVLKKES